MPPEGDDASPVELGGDGEPVRRDQSPKDDGGLAHDEGLPQGELSNEELAEDVLQNIQLGTNSQNKHGEQLSAYNILHCVEWIRDALHILRGFSMDMLQEDQRITVVSFLTNPSHGRLMAHSR